jgi:predicted DNA-binding WGR domain protein
LDGCRDACGSCSARRRRAFPRRSGAGEEQLRELGQENDAIIEAIRLLAPEVEKARKEYSQKVAAQRGAEYQEIVEKIVDAAKALGDSMIEHHQFIDGQRQDGVSWRHFTPLNLEVFCDLDEDFSPLRRLILDAVEKKHVRSDKIPSWRMPCNLSYLQVY